jgi:hypothetical protein
LRLFSIIGIGETFRDGVASQVGWANSFIVCPPFSTKPVGRKAPPTLQGFMILKGFKQFLAQVVFEIDFFHGALRVRRMLIVHI